MIPLPRPARYCPRCGGPLSHDRDGRPACTARGCHYTWYPDPKVAVGVVVEDAGRIVLVRRNHEPRQGCWAFPSGFVDAGEVVEEAAIREVREETGLEVQLDSLIGVYSEEDNPVVFVAYAGRVIDGVLVAGDEAYEARFFEPDDLPALAFDHDEGIMRAWWEIRSGGPVHSRDALARRARGDEERHE